MPKIITDLKCTIIENAKKILVEKGYASLKIRDIAMECGVAVGTVYNYFSSKDMIAATVMLTDWMRVLRSMSIRTETQNDVIGCMRIVYEEIVGFSECYRGTWAQYKESRSVDSMLNEHHLELVRQLTDIIEPILTRFDCMFDPSLADFLAENFLGAAKCPGRDFINIEPILRKLLS